MILKLSSAFLIIFTQLNLSLAIHAGDEATQNAVSDFVVSIRFKSKNKGHVHHCGASFVAAKYLLTAGHCADGMTADQLLIYSGSNKLSDQVKIGEVKAIHLHPEYKSISQSSSFTLKRK